MKVDGAEVSPRVHGGRVLVWLVCGLAWLAALGFDVPLISGYFPANRLPVGAGSRLFPRQWRVAGPWIWPSAAHKSRRKACTYKYPPPFLFLATPLSWLTPEQDFSVWSAISVIVLVLGRQGAEAAMAGRVAGGSGTPYPAVPKHWRKRDSLSGLLLLALGLAETAPLAAGIAAGAMIVKPEFGLLLPVCYGASRNGRAFVAAVTVGTLCRDGGDCCSATASGRIICMRA